MQCRLSLLPKSSMILNILKQYHGFETLANPLMRHMSAIAIQETNDLDASPTSEDMLKAVKSAQDLRLPHSWYTKEQLETQVSGHHVPVGFTETLSWYTVSTLRFTFDVLTGYNWAKHTEKLLLRRIMFLETIAGIPGMVGALNRHLRSLRKIQPDYGWIHTLLEEAENERMHLMTALLLLKPGFVMKSTVVACQAFFFPFYSIAYAISPLFCHRFVGYLEEEAFKTYTTIVKHVDDGKLPGFTKQAPLGAIRYWNMPETSTLRDVFLAIRADENHHRLVNHTFASLTEKSVNPFPPGF